MGVPTLFIRIFRNKSYKNVHNAIKIGAVNCDYFFIDFNGIIYTSFEKLKKTINTKNLTKNQIEENLIEEVIRYTKYLVSDVIKPKKITYISFDGPAPRAKMVQQRSRRYSTYHDKIYKQIEKKKYIKGSDGTGTSEDIDWDTSANISPGTEFMYKLSLKIQEAMTSKHFSTHDKNMSVILSDPAVPGEGEHKFLDIIRKMATQKGDAKNDKVYIFGKDADLIVLAVATHKNNMFVVRDVKSETDYELKKIYEAHEFLALNIDNLRNGFNQDITRSFEGHTFDKNRILNDYIFLTFLVGNDFGVSLPFLKVKKDGLPLLISIYSNIKLNHPDYLVSADSGSLNIDFFKELILELSKKEDFAMKNHQRNINRQMKGAKDNRREEAEQKMSPFEIFESRYQHVEVCNPDHPLYSKYFQDFMKIDYNKEYEVWKEAYYSLYVGISKKDEEDYNDIRQKMVKNYLEGLVFTLNYYYKGIPSWTWHYKFRVPPLFSDIYQFLDESKMNDIKFDLGKPYTPFQQLMCILPPQMNNLLPAVLRPIMTDDSLLCTQFYPIDFRIDASFGVKTMYSEAILPEIDDELLLGTIKTFEKDLTEKEKERNTIRERPMRVLA